MTDLRDYHSKGDFIFEESYSDTFSGVERKRSKVKRDYQDRLIEKGEDNVLDRDELLKHHTHRTEHEDIDP